MTIPKKQLIHAIWDIHQSEYSVKPVGVDPVFASQMAANIFCPGPSYYYILDFANREFTFVSPTVEEILGIKPNDYSLNELLERVHPNDVPHVTNCEGKIIDFLFNKIQPEQLTRYKFAYSLRVRHTDGSYRLMLHQALALSQDGFGRMSKVLGIDTSIGHITPVNNYRLSIIGLEGEPSYLGIDSSLENYLSENTKHGLFTSRELEIIRLFADGHTAEKVANILGLSSGTIRTHRQNILHKSGCKNMTAVAVQCVREGVV